jgi:acetyl esterase/lipase
VGVETLVTLIRNSCLLAIVFILVGCNPLTLINAVSPDRHYSLQTDLAFGQLPRQQLDLARPEEVPPTALIVFFYGGAWTSGRRQDYHFVIDSFAKRGFAVAIPDYRLYPEVQFPAFVEDGAMAVAWLQEHAGELGISNLPVFLMGHSAGAHIAAMLHFDERFLRQAGSANESIAGFIGLAGPYDFLPFTSEVNERIFAPSANFPASQPINFVSGDEAPILLLQGEADETVFPRNSQRLAKRFHAAGGQVETHYYPDLGHLRILLALSSTFDRVPVVETSTAFINRVNAENGSQTPAADNSAD